MSESSPAARRTRNSNPEPNPNPNSNSESPPEITSTPSLHSRSSSTETEKPTMTTKQPLDTLTSKLLLNIPELDKNGSNWTLWKHKVANLARFESVLDVMLGLSERPVPSDETKPSSAEKALMEAWDQKDVQAQLYITSHLCQSLLISVIQKGNSHAQWKLLTEKFEGAGPLSAATIVNAIVSWQLNEEEDMEEQISAWGVECDKLGNLGLTIEETIRGILLMNSLPESYSTVKTLVAITPIPSITVNSVRALIVAEERRRKGDKAKEEQALKAHASQKGRNNQNQRNNQSSNSNSNSPKCPNCKRPGHTIDKCWRKGGGAEGTGPKWYNERDKSKDKEPKAKVAATEEEEPVTVEALVARVDESDEGEVVYVTSKIENSRRGNSDNWILDSGASRHISNQRKSFKEYRTLTKPIPIWIANNSCIYATGEGSIPITMNVNNSPRPCQINRVLYAQDIACNLMSIRQLQSNGSSAIFPSHSNIAQITSSTGIQQCEAKIHNGLYVVQIWKGERAALAEVVDEKEGGDVEAVAMVVSSKGSLNQWHRRLGHLNIADVKALSSKGMVNGMIITKNTKPDSICESCQIGKHTRSPISKVTKTRATRVLERVHSDVCTMVNSLVNNFQYLITFTDDYSRFTVAYAMSKKSEALSCFKKFYARAKTETGQKMLKFRTDGGGEYTSKEFEDFLSEEGIQSEKTPADTPQLNGVSERKNRTLIDKVVPMLNDAKLPQSFWPYALGQAVYILNRSPTSSLNINKTPFELYYNTKPTLTSLREFGCTAWAHVLKKNRPTKLSPRSIKCKFIGLAEAKKAFRLWDPVGRKIIESRDVKFDEGGEDEEKGRIVIRDDDDWDVRVLSKEGGNKKEGGSGDDEEGEDSEAIEETEVSVDSRGNDNEKSSGNTDDIVNQQLTSNATTPTISTTNPDPRRSTRVRTAPVRDDDDRYSVSSYEKRSSSYKAFVAKLETDPQSFREAMDRPDSAQWFQSAQEEIASQKKAKTHEEVEAPHGAHILPSRWVFKLKTNPTTGATIYKSRLVAKGFNQRPGEEFDETYAPTVHKATLYLILALAAKHDLVLGQIDIKTAFLNGDLDETIYMRPPEGFPTSEPGQVWKLRKSIYGLKQAARQWYKKLKEALTSIEFVQLDDDNAVFILRTPTTIVIIAAHVDDMLLAASTTKVKQATIDKLSETFDIHDLGPAGLFCGLRIKQDLANHTISVDQSDYLDTILRRFGMQNSRPMPTPMVAKLKLPKLESPQVDVKLYQSMLGCVQWLSNWTRPDITFPTNNCAQHIVNPGLEHLQAMKHLFRFLNGTRDYKLIFDGTCPNWEFMGYVDADWASDPNTRRSVTGFVFFAGGTPISWASKKQKTISLSSTEAEYIAASTSTCEIIWLRRLFDQLGFPIKSPTRYLIDNTSCISLIHNPSNSIQSKHIDVRYHFIREQYENGIIEVEYIPTEEQLADIFTKPLPSFSFQRFVPRLLHI